MIDFFLPATQVAQAAEGMANVVLNVPIGQVSSVNNLAQYFQIWYSFVIGSIGILATVMVMWGGFKWLTSRGNAAAIGEAKERIISALIGLSLVFLSYTILEIINPRLVNLSMPGLETELYVEDEHLDPRTPAPPPFDMANKMGSVKYSALEGDPNSVKRMEKLLTDLESAGALPSGWYISNVWRGKSTSQHKAGKAIDITWIGINKDSANALARAIKTTDPSFSFIAEYNGDEFGSHYDNGWGVHIDTRSGNQFQHEIP